MKILKKTLLIIATIIIFATCLAGCDMSAMQSGAPGTDGKDGKSAYEIWLDSGHSGTEEDFLEWLREGEEGPQGKSTYEIWLEAGHEGNLDDFLNWLKDNPTSGGATAQPESEGLDFELLDDGTYKLVGLGSCQDDHIVIPATYKGEPVTVIGEYAFAGDYGMIKSIVMPDSIKVIEDWAIFECPSLEELHLSNNLEYIGIMSGLGYKVGVWKNGIRYLGNKSNPYLIAYSAKKDVTNAVIEEGCSRIESDAFEDCRSLTSVTIGNNVTSIGDYAFSNCDSLTIVNYSGSQEEWEEIDIGYGFPGNITINFAK